MAPWGPEGVGFAEMLLPAHPAHVRLARAILRTLAAHAGFSEVQAGEMAVALSEAYTNVIQHANTTWVTLRFALEPDALTIEVEDDGEGFDTAILDQPYSPEREVGRGMHLIRSLMDAVECQSSPMGTIVRMTRLKAGRALEQRPWKVAARPFRTIGHIRRTIDRYQRDLALMLGEAEPIDEDLDDLAIMERFQASGDKESLISDRKLRIKTLQATLEILREDAGEEQAG
ncbi:MAG: ATP-binding protein [Armatimonadota bacterium]|nr:ATP-binding protein [Armatimonadota bacterium]MDR7452299.1 ATP-binding protein [Armatimonadota bacterium]MDR7467938.1 ATP-binding protein [Armatimonadota bacterium]MDR7494780.1 ATP-binding protein [Armatimonadota bacterium]MDR7499266.1 ATP-binding protein [Armatimonadota bacterium]